MPSAFELCLMQSRVDRSLRSALAPGLETHGLSVMEWLVLNAVHRSENRSLSMSDIASILDVTLPQVTALVTRLVKQGLVKQKTYARDKRGRLVTVTMRGRRTLQKLESASLNVMSQLGNKISDKDLRLYAQTLNKLSVRL